MIITVNKSWMAVMPGEGGSARMAVMGSVHSHRHSSSGVTAAAPGRALMVLLGVIGLLVVVGMVLLWPAHPAVTAGGLSGQLVSGTVRSTQLTGCGPAGRDCERSVV